MDSAILLVVAARRAIEDLEGHAAVRSVLAAPAADAQASSVDRATVRTAVRWTLQLLAQRAPGHSVEVRVPPLAAIQAVAGPTHRRGTPSAVVEMDPETWLGLATGALGWEQARADGRIRASGERADLSPWLPVLTIREG
ncbi:MAG: sterol carrier family protein [Candidatus Nanopelagicales bacterium]|nr:sterol carrier family protein [Candidatus Nanopelagicales bacterium]